MSHISGKTLGRYEVQGYLAGGGMADVYKGYHPGLGRPVAIKVLKPKLSRDPAFVEAFVNEARFAAQLSHPHIVTIHDVGEQGGSHYIVMEYIPGQSLQQLIHTQGALPARMVCQLFDQIADALNYAQRRGFVHCDIKPSNVLLDADGRAKLMDFGIARAMARAGEEGQHSRLIGSPRYMSPEHALGKSLDHRSDTYSLGVVLFEMLTGRVPFDGGTSNEIMRAHVRQSPPPPTTVRSELPAAVDQVVLRALAKEPEERYQNALQMTHDVRLALLGGAGILAQTPVRASEQVSPQLAQKTAAVPARRFPPLAAALLAAGAVLVAAAAFVLPKIRPGTGSAPTQTPPYVAPTASAGGELLPATMSTEVAGTATPAPAEGPDTPTTATTTRLVYPTSTLLPTRTSVPATATPVQTSTRVGPQRITAGNAGRVVLLRTLTGHWGWVGSVVFSPDGTTLASASGDRTVRLWRVDDGALLRTLEGHTGEVYSAAFSPDGSLLASGAMDHTVRLWRTSDGSLQCTGQVGDHAWARILAFDPSGRSVAGDSAEVARVWDAGNCNLTRTISGESGTCVAFSPDGKLLASGSQWRGEIRIVQMSDGTVIRTLSGHTDAVWALAFSPDGNMLASGAGAEIRLWRVGDGLLLGTLRGHENSLNGLAFSPDAAILASAARDSTVRLWHVSDGRLLNTLAGHSHEVNSVAFSPDGKLLASGSGDGTIRLWGIH